MGSLELLFDPKENINYYLLYVLYSTGDTFGRENGAIQFIGLYDNKEVVEENRKRIYKHWDDHRKRKGNFDSSYWCKLLNNNNQEYKQECEWTGFFEYLESVEIETIQKA